MRMGRRMKEILDVLKDADHPLTLSDIVVRIHNGEKTIEDYNLTRLNKVASALVKGCVTLDGFSTPRKFTENGRKYHAYDYAHILYASYSRALQTLWKYDLVRCIDHWKRNRKHWILNVKKPFVNI